MCINKWNLFSSEIKISPCEGTEPDANQMQGQTSPHTLDQIVREQVSVNYKNPKLDSTKAGHIDRYFTE